MKRLKLLLFLPILLLLAGCGVRKKQLLSKLSPGMNKEAVKLKIGKPDHVRCPIVNHRGDVIDIWEYSLATTDVNEESKQLTISILGGILFWPILLVLPFMNSPYEYNTYYLEFINNILSKWGSIAELEPIKSNQHYAFSKNNSL